MRNKSLKRVMIGPNTHKDLESVVREGTLKNKLAKGALENYLFPKIQLHLL